MTTQDYRRELDEAIAAGNRALSALNDAEGFAASASNWGIFDMLGGGMISGLIKHSKMDDAQRAMERAQRELSSFQKELRDVQMRCPVSINFDNLTRIVDIFCDNFFVDLMVQSKIKEAKNSISEAKYQVQNTLRTLQEQRGNV